MSIAKQTRRMSEKVSEAEGEPCCVVCFKPVDIYSIGECDHPVCFECSTRMRVLCLQNECPICRHQLHKVIFTPECLPYKEVSTLTFTNNFFERQFRIGFANEDAKRAYFKLLEHSCRECKNSTTTFRNFEALSNHMETMHDLHFCKLCVDNLKIFTGERKYYTKPRLSLHHRKGDPDDLSHKGHPLCEFCRTRFMDTDELYRHLRKHHLYCHLCDADGYDHYYGSYDSLNEHFRKDHYLCEEGDCSEENLTAVFRTDIDLIAHKALVHGKGLSKQAARQARTLELQFTYSPRPPRPQRGPPQTQTRPESFREDEETAAKEPIREEPPRAATVVAIDTGSSEQFPSLGVSTGSVVPMRPSVPMVLRQTAGALVKTQENFPALGGEPSNASTPTLRVNITHQAAPAVAGPSNAIIKSTAKPPNVSIQVHNRPTTASNFKLEPTKQNTVKPDNRIYEDMKKFDEDFPSLNKKDKNLLMNSYTSSNSTQMNAIVKKAPPPPVVQPVINTKPLTFSQQAPPPPTLSAFPALCPATAQAPKQPQWIVSAKPKDTVVPKQKKVAPAPQIPTTTDINSAFDFPYLVVSKKNKKGNKTEQNNNRHAEDDHKNENGKKEKKKIKNEEIKPKILSVNNKKSIPPDASYTFKENESNKNKNDSEPAWVDWKTKKGNNNNNNKPSEKPANPPPKVKEEPAPKIEDFPALSSNRNVTGFKNGKSNGPLTLNENVKVTNSDNLKNKLSYSANFKKSNDKEPQKLNGKCKESDSASSSAMFQNSIPPCNGFTFTNSSGQSYNIPVYNYLNPNDFDNRNRALVYNFMTALSSQESIDEFKQFSRQFREGVYSVESYYEHCKNAIGEEFHKLFPELLALLPDISKQQELYSIYSKKSSECKMEVCSTCGQILVPRDHKSHIESHNLIENFPTLGDSVQTIPTWRK